MRFFFTILLLFISFSSLAQDSRWIDMEWEPVPDAREYEIELFQEVEDKSLPRGKYKTDSPAWSHAVPPGKYSLRLRSMDRRGVPGEWSAKIPLKVRMQNPVLLRPVSDDKISDPLVTFEWGPVEGAGKFQLIVKSNNKVLHNAVTNDQKSSVYLDDLGEVQWASLALEKDEEPREPADVPLSAFKSFKRVGGLLEAPKVNLTLNQKVNLSWGKVRGAQFYEVDYFPPPGSGDKNRRFKLRLSPLIFPVSRLKEGVSTLTIKSVAPGYQDSNKSMVKIARSGNKVVLEDIIQGNEERDIKTAPTFTFFKNELYGGVILSKFTYESENIETDTRFDQESLTGLGLSAEWWHRPTLNSLNRKLEFSLTNLSSGIDSGIATRIAYSYNKDRKWGKNIFYYGGGLSFLMLPSFMGDRFEDTIEVESTSSLGPELHLGIINPINNVWELQGQLVLAYHPLIISEDNEGTKAFPWMKGLIRIMRYYADKQAFYGQLDYQTWNQEWKEDSSTLSGIGLNFGIKAGF
mgnify:CR=1 FL=1